MRPLALVLLIGGAAWGVPAPDPQESTRVRELLAKLDDDAIEVRSAATAELLELGPVALPELRRAADHAGVELRSRVSELIRKIQEQDRLAALLPPPSRITLDARDAPLREVLRRLSRQTGTPIDYSQVPDSLRVSVSLDHVPFWKAVDRICRASGRIMPRVEANHLTLLPEAYSELPGKITDHFCVTLQRVDLSTSVQFGQQERFDHFTSAFQVSWEKGARPYRIAARIRELVDESGTELVSPDDENEHVRSDLVPPDSIRQEFPLESSRGPGETASKLLRFRVEVALDFPLRYAEAKVDLTAGKPTVLDAADFSLRVNRFDRLDGTLTAYVVLVPHVPLEHGLTAESVTLRDRKGQEYRATVNPGTSTGAEGETPYQLEFPSAPEHAEYSYLIVRLPVEVHRERVDVEFRDLVLR